MKYHLVKGDNKCYKENKAIITSDMFLFIALHICLPILEYKFHGGGTVMFTTLFPAPKQSFAHKVMYHLMTGIHFEKYDVR